jgi:hypothetical protein
MVMMMMMMMLLLQLELELLLLLLLLISDKQLRMYQTISPTPSTPFRVEQTS